MPSHAAINVLILEDEALIAMELQAAMIQSGHTVVGLAEDSGQALEIVENHQVDVALVDIDLRDGPTGIPLASTLVSEHGVVVIFCTANARSIPEHFCGALGVVHKPYDSEKVGEAVHFAGAIRAAHRHDLPRRPRHIEPSPWLRALGG